MLRKVETRVMETGVLSPKKRSIRTASGRTMYAEQGTGAVALFVHGFLSENDLWLAQVAALSDLQRVVAVDLLAHADAEIAPDQDLTKANAKMLGQFLSSLNIDQVDLVGSDSGSIVAQLFAAVHPERIRSLTLMDCKPRAGDSPETGKSFIGLVAAGHLCRDVDPRLSDNVVCLSSEVPAPVYKRAEKISVGLRPFIPSNLLILRSSNLS